MSEHTGPHARPSRARGVTIGRITARTLERLGEARMYCPPKPISARSGLLAIYHALNLNRGPFTATRGRNLPVV